MRKYWIAVLLVLVALGGFILYGLRRERDYPNHKQRAHLSTRRLTDAAGKIFRPTNAYPQIDARSLSKQQVADEVTRRHAQDRQWEWKVPIRFYGKVVDEQLRPVPNAKVQFLWTDISPRGTSRAETTSDAQGLFSLTGTHGKRLEVRVSKDGYYTPTQANEMSYEFANPYEKIFYTPSPNAPVIFQLRKKEGTKDLIAKSISTSIPFGENRSARIDLFTGRESPDGHLVLNVSKPPPHQPRFPYDWSISISVPGGGLIEHADEFPFKAPETGYQPTLEYSFHVQNGMEGVAFAKKFYFVLNQSHTYGRVSIRTDGDRHSVFIDYALNPSGSRNLEQSGSGSSTE